MQYIQPILDSDKLPQIFPYFDANQVSEEHRNEIIVARISKLKEGETQPKQFAYKIINDEVRHQQEKLIGQIQKYLPIKDYNMKLTDYQNLRNCLGDLPADQYVYISYFKDYSEGCQHYIRGCQVKCEVCNKFYPCRICHDDVEDHDFPRYDLKIVKCNKCGKEQPFNDHCIYCNHLFATYKCDICRVLCSLGFNAKPNYHCPKCKVCMVELPTESKHCDLCNQCIKIEFFDNHNCIIPKSDTCPICYSSTIKSIFPVITLPCGHQIHQHCLISYEKQNHLNCPVCRKSLYSLEDLKNYYNEIDRIYDKYLVDQNLPKIYQKVLCNQCSYKFQVKYHPINQYKCPKCQYYNTVVTDQQSQQYDNVDFDQRKYRSAQNQEDIYYVLQIYFNDKEKPLTGEQILKQLDIDLSKDIWFPAFLNEYDKISLQKLCEKCKQIKGKPMQQQLLYLRQFPQMREFIDDMAHLQQDQEENNIQQDQEEIEENYQELSQSSQNAEEQSQSDIDDPVYRI